MTKEELIDLVKAYGEENDLGMILVISGVSNDGTTVSTNYDGPFVEKLRTFLRGYMQELPPTS